MRWSNFFIIIQFLWLLQYIHIIHHHHHSVHTYYSSSFNFFLRCFPLFFTALWHFLSPFTPLDSVPGIRVSSSSAASSDSSASTPVSSIKSPEVALDRVLGGGVCVSDGSMGSSGTYSSSPDFFSDENRIWKKHRDHFNYLCTLCKPCTCRWIFILGHGSRLLVPFISWRSLQCRSHLLFDLDLHHSIPGYVRRDGNRVPAIRRYRVHFASLPQRKVPAKWRMDTRSSPSQFEHR